MQLKKNNPFLDGRDSIKKGFFEFLQSRSCGASTRLHRVISISNCECKRGLKLKIKFSGVVQYLVIGVISSFSSSSRSLAIIPDFKSDLATI